MIHGASSGFTDKTVSSTFRTCVINHATVALSERNLIIETSSEPSGVGQWHASDLPLLENRKLGPPKRFLTIQATSNAIFPLCWHWSGATVYDSVHWGSIIPLIVIPLECSSRSINDPAVVE